MHNPLMMLIALALLFFLARAAWNVHRSAGLVSTRLSQAQAEKDKLDAEKQSLSSKIGDLSTPSGLESELRIKYRAVKEGESVAVIVNKDQTTSSSSPSNLLNSSNSSNLSRQMGWWDKMLSMIGL